MSHSLRVPSDVSTNAPLRVPTSIRTPLIGALLSGRFGTAKASGLSVVSVFGTSGGTLRRPERLRVPSAGRPGGPRAVARPPQADHSQTHPATLVGQPRWWRIKE